MVRYQYLDTDTKFSGQHPDSMLTLVNMHDIIRILTPVNIYGIVQMFKAISIYVTAYI